MEEVLCGDLVSQVIRWVGGLEKQDDVGGVSWRLTLDFAKKYVRKGSLGRHNLACHLSGCPYRLRSV